MRSHISLVNKKATPTLIILALHLTPLAAHAGFMESVKGFFSNTFVVNPDGSRVEKNLAKKGVNTQNPTFENDFLLYFTEQLNGQKTKEDLRKQIFAEIEFSENSKFFAEQNLTPIYDNDNLKVRLSLDQEKIKKNPYLALNDLVLLSLTTNSTNQLFDTSKVGTHILQLFVSPHTMMETIFNANAGSPNAKLRMLQIQAAVFENIRISRSTAEHFGYTTGLIKTDMKANQVEIAIQEIINQSSLVLSDYAKEIKNEIPRVEKLAREWNSRQSKALEKWKKETGSLEKMENATLKLNDLIVRNDRQGVRQLLELYLPWAIMEPAETKAWKIWLDAIEHPDSTKTTIAFRGLDYRTDFVQKIKKSDGTIDYGFMSTVLTQNQGNYTRRLRSLSTKRIQNGDLAQMYIDSALPTVTIAGQMETHAREPKGSSFLSFTYKPSVALNFTRRNDQAVVDNKNVSIPRGGLLAVQIDSRRMIPNISSMYGHEIELLAPLIVFPDEVLAFHDGYPSDAEYKKMLEKASQKSGLDFSVWSSFFDSNKSEFNDAYRKNGMEFMRAITTPGPNVMSCSKVF